MWEIYTIADGSWITDHSGPGRPRRSWPRGASAYVDLGVATLMCDVFNARDYPDVFNKEKSNADDGAD